MMNFKQGDAAAFSAAEDSTDDSTSSADGLREDDETLRSCNVPLGLNKSYVPDWTCQDAFRELYQNWKDGIIASFHIDPRSFKPVIKETPNQIQITVWSGQTGVGDGKSRTLLGYIRFDRKAGSLELTNFRAALDMKHLYLGVSEKRKNDQLAGTHGEGFKLAALVLRRNGRAVKFTSNSFNWTFGWRGTSRSSLRCRLKRINEDTLQEAQDKYIKKESNPRFRRGMTSNAWEDVRVKIRKFKSKNEVGNMVSEADFRSWSRVALDLDPPALDKVIHTNHGDLILDQRFNGLIYLKGLRITGHEAVYVYGYNFIHGKINRDRDRLADLNEEKERLSKIWGEAILANSTDIADIYIGLLQERDDCAEILWTSDRLAQPSVEALWRRLRQSKPNAFFYCDDDGPSDSLPTSQAEIIRKDLKSSPNLVSKTMWQLFRKFGLARTPEEEQTQRFLASPAVPSDQNPFHFSIVRGLRASLLLSSGMSSLNICFVVGGETQLDLTYAAETRSIKIHQKWLDFLQVHKGSLCDVLRISNRDMVDKRAFFCDHVVEDLFELIVEKLFKGKMALSKSKALRRLACACLRRMPRLVRVSQTEVAGELEVSWIGNEDGLVVQTSSIDFNYCVILHKESTCDSRRNDLVYQDSVERIDPARLKTVSPGVVFPNQCGCTVKVISRSQPRACYEGLDPHDKYFPMVARVGEVSFFGAPPNSIAPRSLSSANLALSPRTRSLTSPSTDLPTPAGRSAARTGGHPNGPNRSSPPNGEMNPQRVPETNHRVSATASAVDIDQTEWRRWLKDDLPREFANFRACRGSHQMKSIQSIGSLECPHLDFQFEKGEYACVRLSASVLVDHLILVHGIFTENEIFDRDTTYLLATKYSLLESTFLSKNDLSNRDESATDTIQEVLLHFQNFDQMGLQDDAEIIRIADITSAQTSISGYDLASTQIDHVVRPPQGLESPAFFCRFAIGSAGCETEACLTPIASHLLVSRQDRWKEVKFPTSPKPVVHDFSPEILGPSEGLSQAGFVIELGLGFDPTQHLTWKTRHHTSQVYDGSAKSILEDFDNGRLRRPGTSDLTVPKVAIVAGSNVPFQLSNQNWHLPSLERFVEVLDRVETATQSSLKPTLTVMLGSPAMFHPRATGRLRTTLFRLLERRLSVHMKICSLQDYGLPLQRDVLVLIASSICSSVPWNVYWRVRDPPPITTVETLIRDLAFENLRTTDKLNQGFICLRPDVELPDSQSPVYVHNHNTGLKTPQPIVPLPWDTAKLEALRSTPQFWIHPSRNDLLTVREMARLQGFPDDFVFYNSQEIQYKDVWSAFPPVISRLVGKTIRYMLQRSQAIKMGDRVQSSRAQKRARVDTEVEE